MIYNLNFFLIIFETVIIKFVRSLILRRKSKYTINFKAVSNEEKAKLTNGDKFFLLISFVQLALILCLRKTTVGIDSLNYSIIFQNIIYGGNGGGIEFGSVLLMQAISLFSKSYTALFSVFAILTLFFFYRFIYKNSEDVYLSVAILAGMMFYFQMFNIMRQSLAMAIAIQAVAPLLKKQWIKASIIILIASSFHTTALIFLVILLLYKIHIIIDLKYLGVVILVNLFLLILGNRLVILLTNTLFNKYEGYLSSSFSGEGNILNPIFYLLVLVAVCLISENKEDIKKHLFINMLSVSTFLFTISTDFHIVNRLPYYFSASTMIIIPSMVKSIKDKRLKMAVEISCYAVISLYEVLLVSRNAHGIMPYKSIFDY